MRNFTVLLQKEWREHVRNYRILWLPLVFLLLGMMDPLTYYFMDDLLQAVGNLPDGMQITIPEVNAVDMIVATAGQLLSIGTIIFIALYCSSISGERKNGTATLLYVRPVHGGVIFMSKWVMAAFMGALTTFCAIAASGYYAEIFYGQLPIGRVALFVGIYFVFLLAVITFTLMLSAWTTTAIAAATSIIVTIVGMMLDSMIGAYWVYSPFKISAYGLQYVESGVVPEQFMMTMLVTGAFIVVSGLLGIVLTQLNKRQTNV